MKKKVHGWWFPDTDESCAHAVIADVQHVESQWLKHVKGRKVCVQAGGNCGVYPSKLSQHFEAVYTAEPDMDNFSCLALNASIPNLYAFRAAFGEKPGTIGLHKVEGNVGAHWIEGPGTIPVITIDSLGLTACDLIALDVEGAELLALKGAAQTINKYSPTLIFEEKGHMRRFNQNPLDLHEWLTCRGYSHRGLAGRDFIWTR